jgi:hypothetical protein
VRASHAIEYNGFRVCIYAGGDRPGSKVIAGTLEAQEVVEGAEMPIACILSREAAQELAEDLARAGILPECRKASGITLVLPDNCKAKASGELLIVEAPQPIPADADEEEE